MWLSKSKYRRQPSYQCRLQRKQQQQCKLYNNERCNTSINFAGFNFGWSDTSQVKKREAKKQTQASGASKKAQCQRVSKQIFFFDFLFYA